MKGRDSEVYLGVSFCPAGSGELPLVLPCCSFHCFLSCPATRTSCSCLSALAPCFSWERTGIAKHGAASSWCSGKLGPGFVAIEAACCLHCFLHLYHTGRARKQPRTTCIEISAPLEGKDLPTLVRQQHLGEYQACNTRSMTSNE